MAAIDVLMPMRDAAPWVGAAWRSLERQDFRDWRLVAVDDGSRDRSVETLTAAAARDRRLHLCSQARKGIAAALNRGLQEVAAPVVVRADADDISHPRRLGALRCAMSADPEAAVVATRVRMFPRDAISPRMGSYLRWQNSLLTPTALRNERYVECTVAHASAAFRAERLHALGGWWEGDGPEDLDLFLRLHRTGARFLKLPQTLYFWREHRQRETRRSRRCSPGAFRRTKIHHLVRDLDSGLVHLFGRGRSLAAWSEALGTAGVEVRTTEYSPAAPPPPWAGLALFCFGTPRVRRRIRSSLGNRQEGSDYLFVA